MESALAGIGWESAEVERPFSSSGKVRTWTILATTPPPVEVIDYEWGLAAIRSHEPKKPAQGKGSSKQSQVMVWENRGQKPAWPTAWQSERERTAPVKWFAGQQQAQKVQETSPTQLDSQEQENGMHVDVVGGEGTPQPGNPTPPPAGTPPGPQVAPGLAALAQQMNQLLTAISGLSQQVMTIDNSVKDVTTRLASVEEAQAYAESVEGFAGEPTKFARVAASGSMQG